MDNMDRMIGCYCAYRVVRGDCEMVEKRRRSTSIEVVMLFVEG